MAGNGAPRGARTHHHRRQSGKFWRESSFRHIITLHHSLPFIHHGRRHLRTKSSIDSLLVQYQKYSSRLTVDITLIVWLVPAVAVAATTVAPRPSTLTASPSTSFFMIVVIPVVVIVVDSFLRGGREWRSYCTAVLILITVETS